MKKITKMLVLALALVAAFSMGAGSTAEAKKKKTKVTVKSVTVKDKATGKSISKVTLVKGGTVTLSPTVKVTPDKAANKKVGYKSSKKSVATVSSKGKITAKKAGKATITVYSKKNTKKKKTVKVTVAKSSYKVTSVKLNKTKETLTEGGTVTLKATVKVAKKTPKKYKDVTWASSNDKVAKVSSKGKVTAVKAGTATITVYSRYNRSKKATCKVTVNAKPAPQPQPPAPQPQPPAPKTETVTKIAPKSGYTASVAVTTTAGLTLPDMDRQVKDAVRAAGIKIGDDIQVGYNGKTHVAKWDGTNVKIGEKNWTDTDAAKAGKAVTVTFTVDTAKIMNLVNLAPFAPTSIASITIDGLTFTDIKANSFKIGTKTYIYEPESGSMIIIGDVVADFASIDGKCVTVTKGTRTVK